MVGGSAGRQGHSGPFEPHSKAMFKDFGGNVDNFLQKLTNTGKRLQERAWNNARRALRCYLGAFDRHLAVCQPRVEERNLRERDRFDDRTGYEVSASRIES